MGEVVKMRDRKSYIKMGATLASRLSFVIFVKGRECLEVAINAKGGDCWQIWVIVVIDVKGVHEWQRNNQWI